MKQFESFQSFNGKQEIWQHHSDTLKCEMNIAVYLPPQAKKMSCPVLYWLSGLASTERNFIEKTGFQRYASELGMIVVASDTSPRGDDVTDIKDDDELGQGASFYINATQSPWDKHYRMYDYVVCELPTLIDAHFSTNSEQSISGHSMGGHGALMIGLKNPDKYQSISALAPVVSPSQAPLGQKAFNAYLGEDKSNWQAWDSTELLKTAERVSPILIDQGMSDRILNTELKPELFEAVAKSQNAPVTLNRREGYDHGYYFLASFIGEHLAFHARALTNKNL